MLTRDQAMRLFEYREGKLYWIVNRTRGVKAGDIVGTVNTTGYMQTAVFGKTVSVHRIIFLLHHGYLPEQIDHIDGCKLNNRVENLRDATSAENNSNRGVPANNSSGVKGVCWHRTNEKWSVSISVNKRRRYFGNFEDFDLAQLVAEEARNKFHGEFARHN